MAQQKQSTVEIIELGKTLVKELELQDSIDTLSRWMAHYLAELMLKAENATSTKEKSTLEKECCEIILKLWKERESLDENLQPLSSLKETLTILNTLKQKEVSFFGMIDRNKNKGSWADFVDKINENSKDIIGISLAFSLTNEKFQKSKMWQEKHSAMLTSEENTIIDTLDALLRDYSTYFLNGHDEVSIRTMKPNERTDYVLKKLQSLIEEKKIAFDKLMDALKKEDRITPKAQTSKKKLKKR